MLLHDPQTAGMIPVLKQLGVPVVWRCHVGIDAANSIIRKAWEFLRGYVRQAGAYVFSRQQYVWNELEPGKTVLIAPSIDAYSPKNQALSDAQVAGILAAAGLQEDTATPGGEASFVHMDASPGRVRAARPPALPVQARERVHLVTLPMADLEENAAIVNALQHRANVVVQKSIVEGFGLTVAEAMWKARPVVASRIGGIQDQIEDGRSGNLVDAQDLAAYGDAVLRLLADPELAGTMGKQARQRVRNSYLGTRSMLQYIALYERLVTGRGRPAEVSQPSGYA